MQLTYRFRLYPSRAQEQRLLATLDSCRWLYNHFLERLNRKESGKTPRRYELQVTLPKLKHEHPELKQAHSKVLQMVLHQLYSNLRALAVLKKKGRKVGRLRFKGQGWYKALNYNQSGFKLEGKKLALSKIGEIPIKLHREIKGKIKGVIVKRERSGKWYATFQVENEPKPLPRTGRAVGIDVGIKHFLTDTDGRQIQNPKFYERSLERIRIMHRQLSRKEKGSNNRERARVRLARGYEKLVDQRDDFLHKLSRFYANSYDTIAAEKLNIAGMARNRNLAQKILDASWGKFLRMLSYKAERAGRQFVEVDPRGTSQEYKHGELDRDYNAALNVLERGLVGMGWPELTPVEMGPLLCVPASAVIAGQAPSLKQEAPCDSLG
jgi:putative transposase